MNIEITELEHVYPTGERALSGIELTMAGTEPVAIIGQNGAGKTTLAKHLNGILKPSGGRITIDGVDIGERATCEWAKKIGYAFQNPADQLFLDSVRKEFEFGPREIGMPKEQIEERVVRVAQLVGLQHKLDVHPFDLTPVEKRFCTIGAVVMMDPEAIVFDEPTCGQDLDGNRRLERIISELRDSGKLCITISHDMKFVTANFSRVILMCRGQVLLDGPARSVFAQTDILKQSFVSPPPITRVAQKAGLPDTVFGVDALITALKQERDRRG